jgi:hypothetical protein
VGTENTREGIFDALERDPIEPTPTGIKASKHELDPKLRTLCDRYDRPYPRAGRHTTLWTEAAPEPQTLQERAYMSPIWYSPE